MLHNTRERLMQGLVEDTRSIRQWCGWALRLSGYLLLSYVQTMAFLLLVWHFDLAPGPASLISLAHAVFDRVPPLLALGVLYVPGLPLRGRVPQIAR